MRGRFDRDDPTMARGGLDSTSPTLSESAADAGVDAATRWLADLVPPNVRVRAGIIAVVKGRLWPEEEARVAEAVDKRRDEFRAGRVLARRAICDLGGPDAPIPVGPHRSPIWPAGFVGSISHTDSVAVAAVGKCEHWTALGVDIEELERFHPRLEARVLLPDEIAIHLCGLDPDARRVMTAALFCAKEAYYKCQYPLTGARLTFHDVVIDPPSPADAPAGLLVARRSRDCGGAVTGRFAVAGGFAAAAFSLASSAG